MSSTEIGSAADLTINSLFYNINLKGELCCEPWRLHAMANTDMPCDVCCQLSRTSRAVAWYPFPRSCHVPPAPDILRASARRISPRKSAGLLSLLFKP